MSVRPNTPRSSSSPKAGFTIIELLISVIIIGILVAIVVPVYVTRAGEARIRAAQQDLESLTTAEAHAAIDTGYFFRLYALDDVKGPDTDSIPPSNPAADLIDGIQDEGQRQDVARPTFLFIDTVTGNFMTNGDDIFRRLAKSETNFNWNGPYVNVARKTAIQSTDPDQPYPAGMPLDPWGAPYLLFTKQGMLEERNKNGMFVKTYVGLDGYSYRADRFDRPTLLSLGANGVPGNGASAPANEREFGQGDDIMRQF